MKKILIGYPLNHYREFKNLIEPLSDAYQVVMKDYDYAWLKRNIQNFDVVIPSLKVVIDDRIIDKAKNLKLIFTPTTGVDHIRINKRKRNISVLSLNNFRNKIASISSSAELGFALILALARKIHLAHRDVVEYRYWERNRFIGNQLKDKVLGIIGLGRIGKKIARYGNAFNMKVQYWDRLPYKQWRRQRRLNYLLSSSDIIVLTVPLSAMTHHLINRDNLAYIKKGAFLVNISRGSCIDEKAICFALKKGILAGLGTDVLESELQDYRQSPLYNYAQKNPQTNIIITPHIGGATIEAWKQVFSIIFNHILKKKPL